MENSVLLVKWKKPKGHWSKWHILLNEHSRATLCDRDIPEQNDAGTVKFERTISQLSVLSPGEELCVHCGQDHGVGKVLENTPNTSEDDKDWQVHMLNAEPSSEIQAPLEG